jgi:hypothetical protein
MFFSQLAKDCEFVTTGFPSLDNAIGGGLRRGRILSFMGTSSVGNSLVIRAITNHVKMKYGWDIVIDKELFCPDEDAVIIDPETKEISYYKLEIHPSSLDVKNTIGLKAKLRNVMLRKLQIQMFDKKQIAIIPQLTRQTISGTNFNVSPLSYYASTIVKLNCDEKFGENHTATITKNRIGGIGFGHSGQLNDKFKIKFDEDGECKEV